MCTSAPDAPREYFADYEVYQEGHAVAWGQVTYRARNAADATAADVVASLRQQAAYMHEVDAGAIRLRCIARL
ncbi:hypothetical protein LJR143_002382 [Pseudoxanthomonas sp. LjRoot143]|uniref:hypothetical protein n=1 Tax=unclassified Pseudoxanthomonas TaxID=2645906 RepID=UPI001CE0848F|nr:hypothetical protein [Pseudoxanthomonas sp. PXM01]